MVRTWLVIVALILMQSSVFAQTASDEFRKRLEQITRGAYEGEQRKSSLGIPVGLWSSDQTVRWQSQKKLTYFPEFVPADDPYLPESFYKGLYDQIPLGTVVRFAPISFKVFQIVDANNLILKRGTVHPWGLPPSQFQRITIDDANSNPPVYWMTGYPTNDLVDDQQLSVLGPAITLEPKSYESAIGGKTTIKAFRLLTREDIKQIEIEKNAKLCEKLMTKDGRTIDAFSLRVSKGIITLAERDGTITEINLIDFDAESSAIVRKQLKSLKPK